MPECEKIKVVRYKSVLRVSKATDLPKLGSGNERMLVTQAGMVGLVGSLLSAEQAEGVATGLEWLGTAPAVAKQEWDVSTAYTEKFGQDGEAQVGE